MHYTVVADTDVGISKDTNQDSLLIKHGSFNHDEILLAIICDGMGGLSKGELASATVIRAFSKWFDEQLPHELKALDLAVIAGKWSHLLKELNLRIKEYAKEHDIASMGTTFSGILFINDEYVFAHVGDSRIYQLGQDIHQLTTDHTFVAREVRKGNMTPEQAERDRRRNLLLQCIGASPVVDPQVQIGKIEEGAYMLCSDGFRHEISTAEMFQYLNPVVVREQEVMKKNVRYLIDLVKSRKEKDNISVVLIRVDR